MYQPKIREDLIPRLYRLGKALNVPMTSLASVLMEYGITMLEQSLKRMGYAPPAAPAPKHHKRHNRKDNRCSNRSSVKR